MEITYIKDKVIQQHTYIYEHAHIHRLIDNQKHTQKTNTLNKTKQTNKQKT